MTPQELKTLRQLCGYTQRELAELLRVHRMTVVRWETGKVPIPEPMSLLVTKLLIMTKK